METKFKIAVIAVIALFSAMCTPKPETSSNKSEVVAENFDWLLGNWKRTNEEKTKQTFEIWEKLNETQYSGLGFTMQDGDTISEEKIMLIKQNGSWDFIVKTLFDNQVTAFKVQVFNDSLFICKNEMHDFPKLIKYWKEGTKLKAMVSGDTMEIPFEFEKTE